MAIDAARIKLSSFTEANVNLRGQTKTWGSNWIYASGGLQGDITLIAHEIDDIKNIGFTPSASGAASLGTAALPLNQVNARSITAGAADASGAIFLYGDTADGLNFQLYRIQVSGGTLAAVAVGAVGDGNAT